MANLIQKWDKNSCKVETKWEELNDQKTIGLLSHLLLLFFHQSLMDKVHLKNSALHSDGKRKSFSVVWRVHQDIILTLRIVNAAAVIWQL